MKKTRILTAIAALAISSALLSYRNNITEKENVEFKKVYFGYYDFSQGKKRSKESKVI